MKTFIFIGGSPTARKTTKAQELAVDLGVSYLSTDSVRDIMEATVRKEDMPNLFLHKGMSAEEFLTKFNADYIINYENKRNREVWKGVLSYIENGDWGTGTHIIEGISVLPELINEIKDYSIKAIFLLNSDYEKVKEVIYERGLYDDARTYSDDVKPKEIEWSLLYSDWLKKEAEKYNYPTLDRANMEPSADLTKKTLGL